jgi:hypothetical protein
MPFLPYGFQVIFTIILCFLVAWTPYALISLVGQFGPPGLLSPLHTSLPAIFAKASAIYNPIVSKARETFDQWCRCRFRDFRIPNERL